MNNFIKEGDEVRIDFPNERYYIEGIVAHVATATGELWYVRTSFGQVIGVNPQAIKTIIKSLTPEEMKKI